MKKMKKYKYHHKQDTLNRTRLVYETVATWQNIKKPKPKRRESNVGKSKKRRCAGSFKCYTKKEEHN